MRERLIEELDGADLFLRNRANSTPTPLNEYDIEAMLDIEKICDVAARVLERAIVPPCKVGDKVYRISTKINTRVKYIQETTISRIAIDNEGIWLFCTCNPIAKCVFGKTVFLTKEEAEAALKGGVD